MIAVKSNFSVRFPVLACNFDAEVFAKAFEGFSNRDLEFECEGVYQRLVEDMLNVR